MLPSTIVSLTRNTEHVVLKYDSSKWTRKRRQYFCHAVQNKQGNSTRFVGTDEIGEETPPEVARKLSPYIMSQLLKGQGQMLLGDGSVAQTTDAKFDEQIISHMKARGGVTIGSPQTSISRPSQPAAPVGAGQNRGIKKGGGG